MAEFWLVAVSIILSNDWFEKIRWSDLLLLINIEEAWRTGQRTQVIRCFPVAMMDVSLIVMFNSMQEPYAEVAQEQSRGLDYAGLNLIKSGDYGGAKLKRPDNSKSSGLLHCFH